MQVSVKLLIRFLCIILVPGALSAQDWQSTGGPAGGQVTAITGNVNTILFAGTFDGGVFRSFTAGQMWEAANDDLFDRNITALKAVGGDTVFAGTVSGRVFRSDNSGDSWIDLSGGLGPVPGIQAICKTASGSILLGTIGLGAYRSSDNGATWQAIGGGVLTGIITDFLKDEQSGIIYAGGYPGVFLSTDDGITWTATASTDFILSLAKSTDGILAATPFGLKKSIDGGTTWTPVGNGLGTNAYVGKVVTTGSATESLDTVFAIATVTKSTAFISTDAGNNFTPLQGTPADNFFQALHVSDNQVTLGTIGNGIYVAMDNDPLQKMNDGLTATVVKSIENIGPDSLAVSTYSGKRERYRPSISAYTMECNNLVGIEAAIAGTQQDFGIFNGFGTGQLFKSENNGVCETVTNNLTSPFLSAIGLNDNTGTLLVGGEGGLQRSIDGGLNFTSVTSGLGAGFIYDIAGGKGGSDFFVSSQFGNFFSDDDGQSFSPLPGISFSDMMAFDPVTRNLVAVAGDSVYRMDSTGTVMEISDGLPDPSDRRITEISIISNQVHLAMERQLSALRSVVFRYREDIEEFEQVGPELPNQTIISLGSANVGFKQQADIILAGTNGGGMYRLDLQPTASDAPSSASNPTRFQLLPNYPNPFNPTTTVSFTLPQVSRVNVRIFNIRGQQAGELYNGKLPAGNHRMNWNAENLPSGNYFIQVSANGQAAVHMATLLK